jgi:hypothetical protein
MVIMKVANKAKLRGVFIRSNLTSDRAPLASLLGGWHGLPWWIDVRRNRRKQLNAYWREQRRESRQAKLGAEFKGVDPAAFLSNPTLLREVKTWIDIAGLNYARKCLSETGVAAPNIDKILEAALGES